MYSYSFQQCINKHPDRQTNRSLPNLEEPLAAMVAEGEEGPVAEAFLLFIEALGGAREREEEEVASGALIIANCIFLYTLGSDCSKPIRSLCASRAARPLLLTER